MAYVSRVVDLLDPSLNTFTTLTLDEARARFGTGALRRGNTIK